MHLTSDFYVFYSLVVFMFRLFFKFFSNALLCLTYENPLSFSSESIRFWFLLIFRLVSKPCTFTLFVSGLSSEWEVDLLFSSLLCALSSFLNIYLKLDQLFLEVGLSSNCRNSDQFIEINSSYWGLSAFILDHSLTNESIPLCCCFPPCRYACLSLINVLSAINCCIDVNVSPSRVGPLSLAFCREYFLGFESP